MLEVTEIQEKLIQFICRNFMVEREDFLLDQSLVDQAIIDSFGLVEISGFIQKEFAYEVQEEEMNRANFGSVLKLVDFISHRIQQ